MPSAANQASAPIFRLVFLWLSALVGCAIVSQAAVAQVVAPDDALRRVTAKDVADTTIALVNLNALPGLGGFVLNVNDAGPAEDLSYRKLDAFLPIDWTKGTPKLDFYSEVAVGGLDVNDEFFVQNNLGDRVFVDADRQILSARAGVGFNYRPTPEWRLTPILGAAWSYLDNKVRSSGSLDIGDLTPAQIASISDFDAQAYSVSGGLEAKFDRWLGDRDYRFEVTGRFSHVFTQTFDESTPVARSSGHVDTLILGTRLTGITDRRLFGEPVAWTVNGSHTSFFGMDREILGFDQFFQVGAGIDLFLQRRILNQPLNSAGLEINLLFGDDVAGVGFGISIRN